MLFIPKEIKLEIFEKIIKQPNWLGYFAAHGEILTLLNKIWPLRTMPSEDSRFSNAHEDIKQHIVNNNDITIEELFLDRLKLLEDDNKFNHFIETVVSPETRKDKEDIIYYVNLINPLLIRIKLKLTQTEYFEQLPVFKLRLLDGKEDKDLPTDIQLNNIPFFIDDTNATSFPCFTLKSRKWFDASIRTLYSLHYHESFTSRIFIGEVKLMKKGEVTTSSVLAKSFTNLPKDYCSLGQGENYYFKLKEFLPGKYQSVLLAIRDAAFFPKITELFEDDRIFKTSLLRTNEVENLMRTIRFKINNFNLSDYFNFKYVYSPPYAENDIKLDFDFENESEMSHRVYALIGKNGTGKTRILSSIAKSLAEKEPAGILPRKPIYGKIFTVSYSFFDRFEIPKSDFSFNYVYCGLKKTDKIFLSEEEILIRFSESAIKIQNRNLINDWYYILSNFIPLDLLEILFIETETPNLLDDDTPKSYRFEKESFPEVYKKLSSGQNILIFIITEILAQIRYNSLILYDEPETHLHPNAICMDPLNNRT